MAELLFLSLLAVVSVPIGVYHWNGSDVVAKRFGYEMPRIYPRLTGGFFIAIGVACGFGALVALAQFVAR